MYLCRRFQHATSGPERNESVAFMLLSLPLYLMEECLRLLEECENMALEKTA